MTPNFLNPLTMHLGGLKVIESPLNRQFERTGERMFHAVVVAWPYDRESWESEKDKLRLEVVKA